MRTCRECGADLRPGAADGLCSRCLLALGLRFAADPAGPEAASAQPDATGVSASDALRPPEAGGLPGADPIRVFGDYELLEEIARGGMGVVYRARQRSLGRFVAVKTLLFGPTASPESVQRFRAEAAAAASLHHPNIVTIHEVGVHQGEHYLVMDLVDGPDLAKFIKDQPLPAHRAAAYLQTVAEAIHHAHERGILHRDLKPSNVLIDGNDQPRVTDFGLAKRFEGDSSLTLSGRVMGSPHYMPPEQAGATRHKVGRRSDVYALGAMLYHMLVGRPPFVGENLSQTLDQVLHHDPVSPRLVNPGVPRDLETICLKCLEKEPSRRYPTARALADELGRFQRHEPIQARPLSPPERLWRWARRKPTLAALVVLLHVVGGLGLAGILWEWRRAEQLVVTERTERERSEAERYAADMDRARAALEAGSLEQVRRLLDRHRPETDPVADKSGRLVDRRNWEWCYYWGRSRGDQEYSLAQGEPQVWCVAFSPTNHLLASGDYRGTLRLWDLGTTQQVARFDSPPYPQILEFSSDAHTLISAGWEHGLRIWGCARPGPGQPREPLTLTANTVVGFRVGITDITAVEFDPTNQVRVWRRRWTLPDGRELERAPIPSWTGTEDGSGVDSWSVFSADGRFLATATNHVILLWDAASGAPLATLTNHTSLAHPLAFSPDSRYLATSEYNGTLKLWETATWGEKASVNAHLFTPQRAEFSPDSRLLVTCSYDRTLKLWQVEPFRKLRELRGHLGEVYDVRFSPDGQHLASASADGTVKFWRTEGRLTEPDAPRVQRLPADLRLWSLASDGQSLLLLFTDHTFSLWDLRDERSWSAAVRRPLGATNITAALVFAGGHMLAFGHADGQLAVHDTTTLASTVELRGLAGGVACLGVSADGHTLAAQGADHVIKAWSLPEGREIARVSCTNHFYFDRVPVSPDGRTLVSTAADGTVQGWAVPGGSPTFTLRGSEQMFVTGVAFFRDGHRLATSSVDKTARVWEVAKPDQPTLIMYSEPTGLLGLALSPDERRLAVGDDVARMGRVKVYDLETAEEVAVLDGQKQSITHVAFWPDGTAIVAVGRKAVCLWRAPSCEEIATRESRESPGSD